MTDKNKQTAKKGKYVFHPLVLEKIEKFQGGGGGRICMTEYFFTAATK